MKLTKRTIWAEPDELLGCDRGWSLGYGLQLLCAAQGEHIGLALGSRKQMWHRRSPRAALRKVPPGCPLPDSIHATNDLKTALGRREDHSES